MTQTMSGATDAKPDYTLLTYREATALLNLSVPSFWRRVADGTIPKPIKIGHSSRWIQAELLAFVEAARAKRDL
jgi:predicted DNA-binding transcriptional regulator AlpA